MSYELQLKEALFPSVISKDKKARTSGPKYARIQGIKSKLHPSHLRSINDKLEAEFIYPISNSQALIIWTIIDKQETYVFDYSKANINISTKVGAMSPNITYTLNALIEFMSNGRIYASSIYLTDMQIQ